MGVTQGDAHHKNAEGSRVEGSGADNTRGKLDQKQKEPTTEIFYPGMTLGKRPTAYGIGLPAEKLSDERAHDVEQLKKCLYGILKTNRLCPGNTHCFTFNVDQFGRIPAAGEEGKTIPVFFYPTTEHGSYLISKIEISVQGNKLSLPAIKYLLDNAQEVFGSLPVSLSQDESRLLKDSTHFVSLDLQGSLIQIALAPKAGTPAVFRVTLAENGELYAKHLSTKRYIVLREGAPVALDRGVLGPYFHHISRTHAEVQVLERLIRVRDLNSKHGTLVSVYRPNQDVR